MHMGTEVCGSRGVVAANPAKAAEIGARIIEAGGNAMDAASAASMACCMLQPHSTGVGGYVCDAVVLEGRTGRVWSVDANAVTPAAAHERMFAVRTPPPGKGGLNEGEYGCSVDNDANVYGPLAVSTPGMMAGMGIVWERWGRLKWADIVAPSQALLADGFPYGTNAASIAQLESTLRRFPATVAHLMPDGRLPKADEIWHRPDMEKTLARVAAAGWRDFYDGEIGHAIADYIQSAGGILTRADMAAYQPRLTDPYTVTYHGAAVHAPILPNGGFSTLETLNLLAGLDLPGPDTPEYWHLLAEVLKIAWRDRLRYAADPDFTPVPIDRLLSPDYAAGRVESIRQFPGHVDQLDPDQVAGGPESTLHVSTADADGNVVSMTISQGMGYGSLVTVPGTGIILGHGMCRLDPRPGRANSIAPGKRPLNNTVALLVRHPDRDIGIGLPGGRYIVSVMARAAHMLVDRGATAAQAAVAPRLHAEGREPMLMTKNVDSSVYEALRAMGHRVELRDVIAGCMNGAEVLKAGRKLRAGSGISAASAE